MKSAKIGSRNIDADGKKHPTSTTGIATPKTSRVAKTSAYVKEAEGIIKGDPKKAGEGVMEQQTKR